MTVKIRMAGVADLGTIMHHRRCMFAEMGCRDVKALDAMEATSAPFIRAGLEAGTYRGWLLENEARVVAGGGVAIAGYPSSPNDSRPLRAWILNVYTEPEFRGRGMAKQLMETMIAWCREQGFKWVSLHASEAGRHIYETMGFEATNEMRLALE